MSNEEKKTPSSIPQYTIGKRILEKSLSARFWMAIMLTGTACYGFLIGKIAPELFVGTIALPAIVFYFERKDRKNGGEK